MTDHPPSSDAPSIFQPTWGRGLFALGLAIVGFLLPQEVPLEWYPLNEPGTDINYLEITCAATITSETQLFLNYGRGFNPLDSIRIPISPTQQAYTYTFPLQDAPLIGLRVDPYSAPGEFLITNLRIINRRNEELRRFSREDFELTQEMARIEPTPLGWKLITSPHATDPYSHVSMPAPLVPIRMTHRNLLRCLLSTGYLTMMLWILLLAVLFTFYRPAGWRDLLAHLGFMACLALLFAFVGNRGLIRNSVHYARYIAPPIPPGLSLEFDLVAGSPAMAQLFFDTGQGYNETESIRKLYEPHQGLQTLRYPLPEKALKALRFDPRENEGQLEIRGIRVVDAGLNTRAVLPLDSLQADAQIAEIKVENDKVKILTAPGGTDPITHFTDSAITTINQVLFQEKPPSP
jgi:hypothetical protein